MKLFVEPEMEIVKILVCDVIATSAGGGLDDPDDGMGWG